MNVSDDGGEIELLSGFQLSVSSVKQPVAKLMNRYFFVSPGRTDFLLLVKGAFPWSCPPTAGHLVKIGGLLGKVLQTSIFSIYQPAGRFSNLSPSLEYCARRL